MPDAVTKLFWLVLTGFVFMAGSQPGGSSAADNATGAAPVPSPSPIQLILEESGPSTDQVAAVDASLFSRDPFIVVDPANFLNSVNRNTRIAVFVTNLSLDPGETAADVHVNLVDSANSVYDLPAEFVATVPGFNFSEVVFKLPDDIKPGTCTISVKWHNQVTNPGKLRIRKPKGVLSVTGAPLDIYLPDNCEDTFVITNVGPKDSTLDYAVVDCVIGTGDINPCALAGFLNVVNPTGSLESGQSATIRISVKPDFVNASPSLVGDDLGLDVYTPDASNYVKFPVLVHIRDVGDVAERLFGTWSGNWSGTSFGPHAAGQPQPTAPISGNWVLNLQTVDLAHQTATGTLTWTGTDIYWTSATVNGTFVATPNNFIPNRTITFGPANTTLTYSGFGGCTLGHSFHLTVDGTAGAPNPSDKFYGPWFNINLNADLAIATTAGNGFLTHPYNPANFDTGLNSGNVSGTKAP